MNNRPLIGVGILVVRHGKVLLGQRKGSLAEMSFELPGGHLEHAESFLACAKRELSEETGLVLVSLEFLCVSNFLISGKHYVDIDFLGRVLPGEAHVNEEQKSVGWNWYDLDNLPSPLFEPAKLTISSYIETEFACHDLVTEH